jgi:riboflavin kinase / FMN adenylyltransferase
MSPDCRVFHALDETPADFGPSAITIGNFDGLHCGHRAILRRVVGVARANGWKAGVLTFDPHPTHIVAPSRAPRLLTTAGARCRLMAEAGIDEVLVLPFTAEIAKLAPEEFVARILVERLHVKAVLVGSNFRFGARQAGDTELLTELGKRHGYTVEVVAPVTFRGRMISSSGVRQLIASGDVEMAWRFLDRPYDVEGEIVAGHGVGSKQTVPTLNLRTEAEILPARGVYLTETTGLETGERWDSITNVGYRPTFDGDSLTIETFLLSGAPAEKPRRIRLEFLRRVRDERKFENPEALKAQIMKDVALAQSWFRRLHKWASAL